MKLQTKTEKVTVESLFYKKGSPFNIIQFFLLEHLFPNLFEVIQNYAIKNIQINMLINLCILKDIYCTESRKNQKVSSNTNKIII